MYEKTIHHKIEIPWIAFRDWVKERFQFEIPDSAQPNFKEENDYGRTDKKIEITWRTTEKK